MKLFSALQIREADSFTVKNEPIASINLMERAAILCSEWILTNYPSQERVFIFCGNGNNGGDGLAMARLLYLKGRAIEVFIDEENVKISKDTTVNLQKIKDISGIFVHDFSVAKKILFNEDDLLIDALLGTGLNKPLCGKIQEIIEVLNQQKGIKISVDIPTGLYCDHLPSQDSTVFNADETLTFQFLKRVFLHPETSRFCGKIHVLNIKISNQFIHNTPTDFFTIDEDAILKIYQPRDEFSHKGNFGKTILCAGSFGKIGAAVLATRSALKTGSGLTFVIAPRCGYEILQSTCPEAMYQYGGENFVSVLEFEEDAVYGIGPGLGTNPHTEKSLLEFLKNCSTPIVLDADALNILSRNKEYLCLLPKNSIITPHPKEFSRLFGNTENSFERLELARNKATELKIYIVLKDHHTQIITPKGKVFYNLTGNSGMAKGGSGDALTGIVTSLLAQKYTPQDAAIFGVWLHGKAGDYAAEKYSKEAMLPSDLIENIGNVFIKLKMCNRGKFLLS